MGGISLLYKNILEAGTVAVTNENSDYPKWRLHDRDIGKLFKGTGTADHTIHVDCGAAVEVDTLIIPAGHNLTGGAQLDWEHSPDDAAWTDMATAWAGAAGLISKEAGASQDKQYWRLVLTSLAAIPEIPELFIGLKLDLADVIAWGYQDGPQGNVERVEALSGRPHFLQQGEDREFRSYQIKIQDSTTRDTIAAFLAESRHKPFYLKDLDGTWRFMSLVDPNIGPFGRPSLNRYDLQIDMLEVLA